MSYKSDFENTKGWNAVDTNIKLTSSHGKGFMSYLKEHGVHTIIRYYASSRRDKTLSLEEAKLINENGFSILPVYQDIGRSTEQFGKENGRIAGRNAISFANYIGQPDGTTILFAVDANFSDSDISSYIVPYFLGVKEMVSPRFRVGVYGPGEVIHQLEDAGLVEVSWLSMSRNFNGTEHYFTTHEWMMRQVPMPLVYNGKIHYDKNIMKVTPKKIGAFKLKSKSVKKPVQTKPTEPPVPPPKYDAPDWLGWWDDLLGGRKTSGKEVVYESLAHIAEEGTFEERPDGTWVKISDKTTF